MAEDLELLQKDNENPGFLSFNHRNCVTYRSKEKNTLTTLQKCADMVAELASKTSKEAKKEITKCKDISQPNK